jgi:tetrahydromethanopterin S-methyltransferase subunit B
MSDQQATAERNYNVSVDVAELKKQMQSLMVLAEQVAKLQRRVDDLEDAEDNRQLQILRG